MVVSFAGCSNLPGSRSQQGAAIGGAAGAATGAAVGGSDHRLLGAILGGVVGAGGGYVIGAKTDKLANNDSQSATVAQKKAIESPATVQDAKNATTADLNNDGFVTLDEVVALKQAGLNDEMIIQRMQATSQVFELSSEQEKYLTDRGISSALVKQIETLNHATPANQVISAPAAR